MKKEKETVIKRELVISYEDSYFDNEFTRNFYLVCYGIVCPIELEDERALYDLSVAINNTQSLGSRLKVTLGAETEFVEEYNKFVVHPFLDYQEWFGKRGNLTRVFLKYTERLGNLIQLVINSSAK